MAAKTSIIDGLHVVPGIAGAALTIPAILEASIIEFAIRLVRVIPGVGIGGIVKP